MNKYKKIFFIVIMIMLLCGCSNKSINSSGDNFSENKKIETENISYTYPQFKDTSLVNKIIEDYANGRCTDNSIDLSDGTHLEGKYTIKYKDDNLISIVFEDDY